MFRRLFKSLAAIAVGMTIHFSVAQAETITVTDTLDRKIEVPADAKRILLGFYFEDFYAIGGPGAYNRVVGISRAAWEGWRNTQWKAYVAVDPNIAKIADIGEVDAGTFSIETAIAARPDVAIIAAWQYKALGGIVQKLEAAGIPVVVADYNAQTVKKHVTSTLMIGKILGKNDRAKKLADQYAIAVADVIARVKKVGAKKPNIYVELGSKGPEVYGNSYGKGMWGGVIEYAGGNNIAKGKIGSWGPLNPEYVIASNPKAIFLPGSDWVGREKAVIMGFGIPTDVTRSRLQPYTKRPGWNSLDAVKSGNVHGVYHGGARTLYDFAFLQYIAKVINPEAFADIDPAANHKKFYETWLPVKPEGTFMVKLGK